MSSYLFAPLPHGGTPASPWEWSWEPSVILGVLLLVGGYLYAIRRPGLGGGASRGKAALFLLGSLSLLLALISPLETLSDNYLFSAHMVQHLILVTIVAPLWLLGAPVALIDRLVSSLRLRPLVGWLTSPAIAFLIFNGIFWLWHWPQWYDLAVQEEGIHIFQHLTLLAAGVIGWWPVFGPADLHRLGDPPRVLYLFACCQPGVALGAILVFARDVLYQTYVDAPRLFGLSPYADQQVGGLIMWIPGNGVFLLALSVIFIRWLSKEASVQ